MRWALRLSPLLAAAHSTSPLVDGASAGRDLGPDVSGFLGDGTRDGVALHLALGVHDDGGVVLEVDVDTVGSSPRAALSDDDGGVD